MNTLAQTASAAAGARSPRSRLAGWSLIVSGVALLLAGEAPYAPPSLNLVILLTTLLFLLGMLPSFVWLADRVEAGSAGAVRGAELVGFAGLLGTVAAAVLVLPEWLPAVPAEILQASSLGAVGLWLVFANALAFGGKRFNRVLAVFGALAGLGWLLAAVVMWVELTIGNVGSIVAILENIRTFGGGLAEPLYLIWALWLGIWLVRRKR